MAKQIVRYLTKNDYTDDDDKITKIYHDAKKECQLAELPTELAAHAEQVIQLIDSVFSEAQMPIIEDGRKAKTNSLNANFDRKEFKELWDRINKKAMKGLICLAYIGQ